MLVFKRILKEPDWFIMNENGNNNFRGILAQSSFLFCGKTEMN